MKVLLVGGTFDEKGGKKSGLIKKISKMINCTVINGGYHSDLKEIIKTVSDKDIVMWFANVPNYLKKIRNVKEINPKVMLITSKRNNGEYNKQEIIAKALRDKANLILEFDSRSIKKIMRLSDPLGNQFYLGDDLEELVSTMMNRIKFLSKITRKSTIKSELPTDEILIENEFLETIKKFAEKFHSLINPMETNRFLGNASKRFRCERGFPSKRINKNTILVSRRNVCKEFIQAKEFVEVYEEDQKLYYKGDKKPSVDTPIQFELYKKLPEVNYMIHSHVYVKNAPFTDENIILPCGSLEEITEIMKVVKKYNFTSNFCINLKGHGCTIFANDLNFFKNIEFIERKI